MPVPEFRGHWLGTVFVLRGACANNEAVNAFNRALAVRVLYISERSTSVSGFIPDCRR